MWWTQLRMWSLDLMTLFKQAFVALREVMMQLGDAKLLMARLTLLFSTANSFPMHVDPTMTSR
jgi:hypothetical protein